MAKKKTLADQLAETGLGRTAPAPTTPDPSPVPPSDADSEGEHARTTTGYKRKDGTQLHRVSVMFTKAERRWLRDRAEDAGLSMSDYVRKALGLDLD